MIDRNGINLEYQEQTLIFNTAQCDMRDGVGCEAWDGMGGG